jgi:uncharacterized protein YkvS
MKLTKQQQKSQDLLHKIISKAWDDEKFKAELIANPIDTIKKATGETVKLPEGKTLIVKDQTDESIIYVNIPAEPNFDDMELNEEQLEAVSGGNLPPWIIPTLPL